MTKSLDPVEDILDVINTTQEDFNYITCQICGKKLKSITNTHLRMHNLVRKDYQNLYPDALLTYELTRKKISEFLSGKNHPLYGKTGKKSPNFGRKHTIESKQKMSESKKGEKNPSFGKFPSKETRTRLSKSLSGHKVSESTKQRQSKSKIGKNNPMFGMTDEKSPRFGKKTSEKTKQKISDAKRGFKHSKESRRKISESLLNQYKTGKRKVPKHTGYGNIGYRADLNQFFRSSWEANVARILNYNKEEWRYEPERFDLGFTTYLPDFFLSGLRIVEIKGLMTVEDQLKIDLFRDLLHGPLNLEYSFILIDFFVYKQLEQKYKSIIPFWEAREKSLVRLFKKSEK